ncbi:MAG: hypothetical protein WA461_07235 [Nitrososphaeraceae archaeon]
MSSSSERENRLSSLGRKMGRELGDDFRRAGNKLRDILIHDFDREMALAEVFADRNDLIEAAYHRALAYAIHNTLRDIEMMIE